MISPLQILLLLIIICGAMWLITDYYEDEFKKKHGHSIHIGEGPEPMWVTVVGVLSFVGIFIDLIVCVFYYIKI